MLAHMNEGGIYQQRAPQRRPLILIILAGALAVVAIAGTVAYLHSRGQSAPTGAVGQQLHVTTGGAILDITVSDVQPAPANTTGLVGRVHIKLVGGTDVYSLAGLPLVFVDAGGLQVPLSVNPVGDLPYGLTLNGVAASFGESNLRSGDTADAELSYDNVDQRRVHGGRLVLQDALGKEIAIWTVP